MKNQKQSRTEVEYCLGLQIIILGFSHDEFYRKTSVITDFADDRLCLLFGHIVDADDAGVSFSGEDGAFIPVDEVGNTVLQKCLLDQLFALGIGDLAQFNFVVYF